MSVTTTVQRDGQHIVEWHTDHLGQKFTQSWFAPANWSQAQIDALVAVHTAQIEANLAESEAQQVLA